MLRSWLTPRHIAAIALVVAIGSLFAWRELGDDDALTSGLVLGEDALQVAVGERVPDFSLDTPDGGTFRLSDYRGQAVVLNFWATWCGPCRAEMPDLQAIHDDHAEDGELVVIGINEQESADAVLGFANELELSFPMALDSVAGVFEAFGIIGLPGTFFIDADGVLRARVLGQLHGELLDEGLASILEGAAASS